MNGRIAVSFVGALLMGTFASAQNQVQVVNTAHITKIDTKKMTLKVKSDPNDVHTPDPSQNGTRGGGARRGGGGGVGLPGGTGLPGGGGRGRRGGVGGGYPGSSPAGGSTSASQSETKEFKIYLSKDTILRDGDATIPFSSLKTGDHIIISGTPKGSDMEAISVTRDSH